MESGVLAGTSLDTSVSGTMVSDDVLTAEPFDALAPPARALAIWFLKDWLLREEELLLPAESRPDASRRTRTVLDFVPPPADPPDTLIQT